jgi:hypothetical protein
MEPGLGDVPYTLTGGVPDWCDFEPQFEDDGTRTLEHVLGRRQVDRTLPNNGVQAGGLSAKAKAGGGAVGGAPSPAKAAAAKALDDEASDDEASDDEAAEDAEYYDVVKMRCVHM